MVVTTTVNGTPGVPGAPGTGLPGTGVPTQRPTTRGRSVADRINQYGTPPPPRTVPTIGGGALGGLIIGGLAFGQAGEQQNAKVAYDTETDTFVLVDGSGRRYATLSEDDARRAAPTVYRRAQQYRARVRKPIPPGMRATDRPIAGEGSRTRSVGSTGGGGARTSGNTPTPRTLLDIQTDLARARTTAGTGDDVRYLTEERDRFRRQITFLENRKSLTDKQKQLLQNLYGELGSAQSELDGIAEDREAALDKQRQDAQDRRDRLRKARHAKAKAAQDKQLKAELEFAKSLSIGAKKQLEGRFPMGDKTLKRIDPDDLKPKNDPAKKNDPNAMTRDELGGILRDFLTGFGDMVDRYYGNVGVGGSISTATLEHLTRQTNGILSDALSRPQVGFRRVIDEAAMQT